MKIGCARGVLLAMLVPGFSCTAPVLRPQPSTSGGLRSSEWEPAAVRDELLKVRSFPHPGEAAEPAVARLINEGCGSVGALLPLIGDVAPVEVFLWLGQQMRVGDVAAFVLMHINAEGGQTALIELVGEQRWRDEGIWSYFQVAATSEGRARVEAVWRRHIHCRRVGVER